MNDNKFYTMKNRLEKRRFDIISLLEIDKNIGLMKRLHIQLEEVDYWLSVWDEIVLEELKLE